MISDRELWACANKVLEMHGGDARKFVASRIAELTAKGDVEGAKAWLDIEARLARLLTLYTEETRH